MRTESFSLGALVVTMRSPGPTLTISSQPPPAVPLAQLDLPRSLPAPDSRTIDERRRHAQATRLVRTLLLICLEVTAGRRPKAQLTRLMSPTCVKAVVDLQQLFHKCPRTEPKELVASARIRICLPSARAVEACISWPELTGRTLAVRLDFLDQSWTCTDLRFV